MNNPKITVLMPVYNAEKFLREAIDSILSQTFKDFEFLIINDGSTDKSEEIILSYKDPRIRYFENKKNLGVAKTLNKGLRLAKGKYIARMDADDISCPNRLEMEYKEIIKNQMVAVVASFYDVIDKSGKYLYTVKGASSPEAIYYNLQFRNCLGHPTVMFNREIVLNEFNGYRNYEAEDYELWLRISKKYKVTEIRDRLHKLRISTNSRVAISKEKIRKSAVSIALNNFPYFVQDHKKYNIAKFLLGLNINSRLSYRIKDVLTVLKDLNINILKDLPNFLQRDRIIKLISKQELVIKFQLNVLLILKCLNVKSLKNLLIKQYILFRSFRRRYFSLFT